MSGADLQLLGEVSWRGTPLPGGRTHALLAALVEAGGRPVGEHRLVEAVWGVDDEPANPAKALQVVVSRARSQTAPEAVARTEGGYRLTLAREQVDALVLRDGVVDAREAEGHGDLVRARARAEVALGTAPAGAAGDGPLGDLRRAARRQRTVAEGVLGRVLSVQGEHEEALRLLEEAGADDEVSQVAVLRSTAATQGAATALVAYERIRVDLADRLGVDPGPALQAVHGELLAADRPVREGLRFESSSLVGRDEDIAALRAVVRESRVTSILGPGGLGKTRLAHLLGREAEQPVVRFVELVGVASPEDVVGEVGSALGVRDSVSGRRVLTAEQRADVRARLAQLLDQAPTLLILDNCEHVVEAVADLVAYLVASCSRLRVVTTTRSPLAISAERVFPLGQLSADAAVELFTQRARAARPGVSLPEDAVRRVVGRLDGLPLAIELAAAKVRVMSVEDVDHRLDDRFALLRGGDRSAPDRHQTLVAVIDWSWNLLSEAERRALRWLSVFHDGFTLAGADALLGHDSLDEVLSLVDQSLLTVLDGAHSVRYRMLETVREFGRMQLVGAGEDVAARDAQLAWAAAYAARCAAELWSPRQVETMAELQAEENNLADCLREAVALPDPVTTVRLLAALGYYWTIKGENVRVIALVGAVDGALAGWEPGPDELDDAVAGASVALMNTMGGELAPSAACQSILERYADRAAEPRNRGLARVLLAMDPDAPEKILERLAEVERDAGRETATLARMWAAHYRENIGDPEGAIAEAEAGLALVRVATDGPWLFALMSTLLASLHAQLGRHDLAARHARSALPELDRLGAVDDAVQARSMLAVWAMHENRLGEAEAWLAEIDELIRSRPGSLQGGSFATGLTRAELAVAHGDVAEGLRRYRVAVEELRLVRFPGLGSPTGLEPWSLFGESAAVAAYAWYAEAPEGDDLYAHLLAKLPQVLEADRRFMDYPISGLVLFGLGLWGLLRETQPVETAVRLLVLADLFAYARFTLTMDQTRAMAEAERRAPGLADRLRAEFADRRGPALLPEAQAAAARLSAAPVAPPGRPG